MAADLAHNRIEAITASAQALVRFRERTDDSLRSFEAQLAAAARRAAAALAERQRELQAAQAALAAADDRNRAACEQRVRAAEARVAIARRAVGAIEEATGTFRSVARSFRSATDAEVGRGMAALRTLEGDLDRYLAGAGGRGGSGGSAMGAAAAPGGPAAKGPLEVALGSMGFELVALDRCDFSDNPITSWDKASEDDVAWALERWDAVVSKVVERGGTQDELDARDVREGTVGTMRRLSGAWDALLGTDAIAISPRLDGSFSVQSGRHRIATARRLGLTHLPMRVLGGGEP